MRARPSTNKRDDANDNSKIIKFPTNEGIVPTKLKTHGTTRNPELKEMLKSMAKAAHVVNPESAIFEVNLFQK